MDAKTTQLIDDAREVYYLPPVDDECQNEDTTGRYVLLERGHYGSTWATWHESPADAAAYSDGQEYPEDWEATVLIDTETGRRLTPKRTFTFEDEMKEWNS